MGAQNCSVTVGEDGEVVALDVEEGEDDVFPAILEDDLAPLCEAILADGVVGVDDVEQHIVEEGLEGGDGGAFNDEEGGERVGACDADGEDLAEREDEPEVAGAEVGELGFPGFFFDRLDVVIDGFGKGRVVDFWERFVMGDLWSVVVTYNFWQILIVDDLWKAVARTRHIAGTSRSGSKVNAGSTHGGAVGVFGSAHGGSLVINRSMLHDATVDSVIGALCRLASAKLLKSLAVGSLVRRYDEGKRNERIGQHLDKYIRPSTVTLHKVGWGSEKLH